MRKRFIPFTLSALPFALCSVGALLLAPRFPAEGQQPKKTYRIGSLSPRGGFDSAPEAFRQSMRDLGYIEGQNLVIEWRFAKGKSDLFPMFAAELIRLRSDCIVAIGVGAIRAVKQLTDTVPIVMGAIDADPVELGFIASLARPGGNITGFTGIPYDIAGKRLELLKETLPRPASLPFSWLVEPQIADPALGLLPKLT